MLKLKNIRKTYEVAGAKFEALKGLNICFRKNEFVSMEGLYKICVALDCGIDEIMEFIQE